MSVVPVPAPSSTNDGKRPVIRWKEYQSRRPVKSEMARWFEGPTNYAVITGRVSGIVVVDVDSAAAVPWVRWNLVPTPWVVKTHKGWHLYYRPPYWLPVGNRARFAGMALDVRGDGGYVIGPGSSHASGAVYRAVGNWRAPRASVPRLPRELFSAAPTPVATPAIRRPACEESYRARRYLSRIPRPILGHGSDNATFIAACRLVRGFRLSPDDTVALLQEWAPDFDAIWLRAKVDSALVNGSETIGGRV